MTDPGSLVTALYNVVIGGSGQSGAQGGSTNYVALEWPAMPVDPARYGNIWSTDRPNGSAEALEAFSSLVDDDLPALAPLFEPTGLSLSQIYALILQATVPSGPLAKSFAAAQEKFSTVVRGSLESPGINFRPSWPEPIGWCDPPNESIWTKVTIAPTAPSPTPLQALPAPLKSALLRPEFKTLRLVETAPPADRTLPPVRPGDPINPIAQRMRTTALRPQVKALEAPGIEANQQLFRNAAISALAAKSPRNVNALAGKRGMLATVTPAAAARAGAPTAPRTAMAAMGAADIQLSPSQIVAANVRPFPGFPRFPDVPVAQRGSVPAVPASPLPPVRTQPVSTSQVGLSFKYVRVSIRRTWLDPMLLRLLGWSVDGLAAGSISNGKADVNPGLMPIIPIGFFAIKDVVINGQWSQSDRQSIQSAMTGGSMASLGPFALAAGGPALGGFDGSSLTLPGVSIIAWTCSLVPLAPPL
jgi:hypothetical protein